MASHIYTNWRGKQFVIDQSFIEDLKKQLSMNGEPDLDELVDLTSELLMEMIPTMEGIERSR